MEKKLIRKSNPYYSGRGRPSESAIEWEFGEDMREDFNKAMGAKLSTAEGGKVEFNGFVYDSKIVVYEKGYCINFGLNF